MKQSNMKQYVKILIAVFLFYFTFWFMEKCTFEPWIQYPTAILLYITMSGFIASAILNHTDTQ
jgi:hypothetical protein